MKKIIRLVIILGVVGMVYVAAPYFAGMMELGGPRGPVLWPEKYHETLFVYGCDYANGYMASGHSFEYELVRRALFYGLPERPYPKEKRLEVLKMMYGHHDDYIIDFMIDVHEKRISKREAEGQYSVFDKRRKIFIRRDDW